MRKMTLGTGKDAWELVVEGLGGCGFEYEYGVWWFDGEELECLEFMNPETRINCICRAHSWFTIQAENALLASGHSEFCKEYEDFKSAARGWLDELKRLGWG